MLYMSRASHILQNHKGKKPHAVINLVAMIDMLTVLVFFLLVYSTERVEVVPNSKDVQLPESIAQALIEQAVVVIVGEREIVVHGRSVARITDILASDAPIIPALQAELEADAAEKLQLAALAQGALPQGAFVDEASIAELKVTIMADRDLPFKLLRKVMATSTAAGYSGISLAVMQRASDLTLATVASN